MQLRVQNDVVNQFLLAFSFYSTETITNLSKFQTSRYAAETLTCGHVRILLGPSSLMFSILKIIQAVKLFTLLPQCRHVPEPHVLTVLVAGRQSCRVRQINIQDCVDSVERRLFYLDLALQKGIQRSMMF